ncbi:hypothetical protein V9L05_12145 [Bernardetia sp. Wsw4-3y2]|uniref:hypothetical protein n=1 Tax=Bernardetia sp. Wsw4-3y2 TaxID=3127471 RepID=UPI0030CF0086
MFDYNLTQEGYKNLDYSFTNKAIENQYLHKIIEAAERNCINIGIDFNQPWEEMEFDEHHYQIEYLFVGELLAENSIYIQDNSIGINVYHEPKFGIKEFKSKQILNLTLILEKYKKN